MAGMATEKARSKKAETFVGLRSGKIKTTPASATSIRATLGITSAERKVAVRIVESMTTKSPATKPAPSSELKTKRPNSSSGRGSKTRKASTNRTKPRGASKT